MSPNNSGLPVVLAILMLAGCGKQPEAAKAPAVPPAPTPAAVPPAPENFAREKPTAGRVEHVTVRASGHGPSVPAAVNQALQLAVEQVNGKSLDASSVQFHAGMAAAIGEQNVDIGSAAFASLIETHSRGAVTGFKVVSQQPGSEKGTFDVTIEASVAKFAKPATADRLRIAVAPFRANASAFTVDTTRIASAQVAQQLRDNLTNALTQTSRVSVLDREFSAETDSELELIASGKISHDDFSRLGQQLATDYLLVGRIETFGYDRHERKLRTSDRTLVSMSGGATLTLRLVNVATSQIEHAETISIALPPTEPTTMGTAVNTTKVVAELTRGLSDQAAQKIISRLFPVTVVAVDGDDVVLSQGGQALMEGQQYEVVARGREIKDPQTGQSLGRMEKPCCIVLITKVTQTLAYGSLVRKDIDVTSAFAPGALEVRSVAATIPRTTASVQEVSTPPAPKRVSTPLQKEGEKPPPPDKDSNW